MRKKASQKTAIDFYSDQQKARQKNRLTLLPPESVPIQFELAPLATRFSAQFLDLLLTYIPIILLIVLIFWSRLIGYETAVALIAILTLLARIPYYILTELVWNGQTWAKRLLKIRVVSVNGRRLEPYQVVARNVMKEAEVFMPISLIFGIGNSTGILRLIMGVWLIVVICVPFFSKKFQRMGDIVAGTCVIRLPNPKLLKDLAKASTKMDAQFEFLPNQLEHYGKFELQTLETILRDGVRSPAEKENRTKIVGTIAKKIGFAGNIKPSDHHSFLMSFYTAQRAYLEGRKLFGDERENKLHNDRTH